jgi:ribosome modulation factor
MLIKPNIRKKRKQERDIQRGFQALVEGLSQRIMPIKSVGVKIVELEEQKEQLDNAALDVGLEIDATKAKVVSAHIDQVSDDL